MNKNDFKNPLIQSGAVLLFVFLLISIVAASGSQGVWGSIGALFSGLITGFIFLLALCFAIIFSIFVIIGLFIAAVCIYSVDKGKEMWSQFLSALTALFQNVTSSGDFFSNRSFISRKDETSPSSQPLNSPDAESERLASIDDKLNSLEADLSELKEASKAQADRIAQLHQQIANSAETDELDAKFADIAVIQQALETRLEETTASISSGSETVQQFEKRFTDEISSIQEELQGLHEKTSVPDTISGILSYIDSAEDRDLVTEKSKEAVARNMTYSQIDEFFKASLKPDVYEEIASHPRLTKDFLRSIKKKF